MFRYLSDRNFSELFTEIIEMLGYSFSASVTCEKFGALLYNRAVFLFFYVREKFGNNNRQYGNVRRQLSEGHDDDDLHVSWTMHASRAASSWVTDSLSAAHLIPRNNPDTAVFVGPRRICRRHAIPSPRLRARAHAIILFRKLPKITSSTSTCSPEPPIYHRNSSLCAKFDIVEKRKYNHSK